MLLIRYSFLFETASLSTENGERHNNPTSTRHKDNLSRQASVLERFWGEERVALQPNDLRNCP